MRSAIVNERTIGNRSAHLPGCVAKGAKLGGVEGEVGDASSFNLYGLLDNGLARPDPASQLEYLEIAV